MRIKLSRNKVIFIGVYLALIVGCFVLPSMIEIGLCMLFIGVACIVGNNILASNSKAVNLLLTFPVLLSCIQNLYLGLAVDHLSSIELQILLTLNIILAFVWPLGYMLKHNNIKENKWCIIQIIIIFLFAIIGFFFHTVPITSFISCLRNILAPFIFLLFGMTFGKKTSVIEFKKYILPIILFVIIFGFAEYFIGDSIWRMLNISKLWNLKGIITAVDGFPSNWYASEVIFGRAYLRRMVSCFADPVNLGTFLFAAFLLCWFYKKYSYMILTLLCCVLTISKGALLGVLIFGVIFLYYKDNSKIITVVSIVVGLGIGIAMLKFGAGSSTGLHVTMFIRSLSIPFSHPMGLGVGSIGVLASVTGGSSDITIMETGIGVVIAQLGIIGIITYSILFYKLIKVPKNMDKRSKILFYSLVFAFFANAMFNEVALSPNSCGIYFIVMGLMAVTTKEDYLKERKMV